MVGIVGSVREDGLAAPSQRPTIYTAFAQSQMAWFFNPRDLAVRVRGNPIDAVASIRQAIWSVDKNQTIAQVRPLEDIVQGQLSSRNLQATILGSFSTAALILAAFGVYALLSFVVASRTQELGVRIALGALVAGPGQDCFAPGIRLGRNGCGCRPCAHDNHRAIPIQCGLCDSADRPTVSRLSSHLHCRRRPIGGLHSRMAGHSHRSRNSSEKRVNRN